jgi:hypothetical protein
MAASEGISLEHLRVLAERVGLKLSDAELEHLKPMYDHYMPEVQALHELELDVEDLAVVFAPQWDPEG